MARSVIVKRVALSFLLVLGSVGCKASVNAEAKASTDANGASAEGDASFESSSEQAEEPAASAADLDKPVSTPAPDSESQLVDTGEPALLGARRDLTYQGPKDATCSCLAVKLGEPSDPAFAWEKGAPTIDSSRQIVVGLTSEGVACDAERGLGASYKGYVVSQNDVVIMVERAHEGRPVQSGAIIPRPQGDGQVFVVAAEAGSPFGGAPGNPKERCHIENVPAAAAASTLMAAPPSDSAAAPPETEAEDAEPSEFVDVIDEHGLGEDKPPPAPETRDGFFLGFHPGASYMILKGRDNDAKYTGVGVGLDVLIGGAPFEGFTIGGIIGGATFPSPKYSGPDADLVTSVDLNLFRVGAFLDYYTDPDSGFHLMAELGYGQVDTSGSKTSSATLGGVFVAGGLGYDWWVSDNWSLGLLGRFGFGATEHSQSGTKQWLMLPALNFTATYH